MGKVSKEEVKERKEDKKEMLVSGELFSVRVVAGARREQVEERGKGGLCIAVRAKAKQGEATKRARELFAEWCGVQVEAVQCVKGARSPAKIFCVRR
jgi:uncharacterized protein YggU (UPF0235/DUF167 family)